MEINGKAGAISIPQLSPSPKLSTPSSAVANGNVKSQGPSQALQEARPQVTPVADAGKESKSTLEELRTAVDKIQEFVSAAASDIKFSIDEESGRTVVRVVDRETKEVIRQIPSQEMLDLAQALDKFQGLLIKQKA